MSELIVILGIPGVIWFCAVLVCLRTLTHLRYLTISFNRQGGDCDSLSEGVGPGQGHGPAGEDMEPKLPAQSLEDRCGARVARNYAAGPGTRLPPGENPNPKKKMRFKSRGSRPALAMETPEGPRIYPPGWKGKELRGGLRDKFPHEARVVAESESAQSEPRDSGNHAGVVDVEYKGRFDASNAVGANVAKAVVSAGGGERQIPGKVIGVKGREFTTVYLDGSKEKLNVATLRSQSGLFCTLSSHLTSPMKPLVVRMM